jgi:hypothetical protein
MVNSGSGQAEGSAISWWDRPAISDLLIISTYILGGIGIALGFYGLFDSDAVRGLHLAVPFMVGAVGILSFIRHSIFHRSDAERMGVAVKEPFFMIELGFANGAIGIIALLVFFRNWGAAPEVAVTLTYALYLALAFIFVSLRRARAEGLDAGMMLRLCFWALQVGLMFFFAIAAAVSAGL